MTREENPASASSPPVGDKCEAKNRLSTSENPAEQPLGEEAKQEDDSSGAPVDKNELSQQSQECETNKAPCGNDEKLSPKPLPESPTTLGPFKNPYRNIPAYLTGTVGRPYGDPETHRKLAYSIDWGIFEWVREYCVDGPEILDYLSNEEKGELMKRLSGYCTQTNWTSLVNQLEPNSFVFRNLPQVLAAAILAKSVWEDVVKDPFFFLTDDCNPMPCKKDLDLFLPSRSQIHNMWRWCQNVNSFDAADWRRLTLAHLIDNGPNPFLNKSPSFGEHTMKLRDEWIETKVRRMISPFEPLHRFMKDLNGPETQKRRMGSLLRIYWTAEQLCCGLHTQDHEYCYNNVEPHSLYSPGAKNIKPSWAHLGESLEKQEEKNRPVLFQFRPAVKYAFGDRFARKRPDNATLLWAATAVLSDYSRADDTCS